MTTSPLFWSRDKVQYPVNDRLLLSMVGSVVLLSGLLGCQVARSSFQMDSDSRLPFFGLHLVPKKKKPDVSPLSQSENPAAEATVAGFSDEAETPRPTGWSKWFGRFGKPKRIPLPITDSQSDGDSPEAVAAEADGLAAF